MNAYLDIFESIYDDLFHIVEKDLVLADSKQAREKLKNEIKRILHSFHLLLTKLKKEDVTL